MSLKLRTACEVEPPIEEIEAAPPPEEVLPDEGHTEEQPQILAELVIEEIGIDGMCGVY